MGFWKRLFSKPFRKKETEPENWEEVVYNRSDVDFREQEQRSRYILNCLEQMAESSKELDLLTGEYALVTSYLTDMEEIEALPEEEHERVVDAARKLSGLDEEMKRFRERTTRLSEREYQAMRAREGEVEDGIRKIHETEHMAVLIKRDLRRLSGERSALEFRREELEDGMNNLRGMAVIFVTAFLALMGILAVLQFGFEMEVFAGYFLAVAAFAIAITVVCVHFLDDDREHGRVCKELNKVIQLQNTVKIRYVNNRKLLEYYYLKYGCESGNELQKKWTVYLQEREDRRQFTEAEAKAEFHQKQLIELLAGYRVKDPDRWVNQIGALLDNREMVEIRHGLILRRQSLRQQMDYNRELAQTAKGEITEVARIYPSYAREILDMTERYEKEMNL